MTFLSEAECEQVRDAIMAAERRTDAELVTVLASRSDSYGYIASLYAAALALLTPAVLALTPLWLSGWELLTLQWGLFLLFAVVLRWPPLLMRLVPRRVRHWRAANMARRQFLEQNLHHTAGETGVLIFVSAAEHYVEIIADRGVRDISNDEWQAIIDGFTQRVRKRQVVEGFVESITRCGDLLAERVPLTQPRDELPNHLVVLR
jgi:putative membrane protein